jgi:hypothetical protein
MFHISLRTYNAKDCKMKRVTKEKCATCYVYVCVNKSFRYVCKMQHNTTHVKHTKCSSHHSRQTRTGQRLDHTALGIDQANKYTPCIVQFRQRHRASCIVQTTLNKFHCSLPIMIRYSTPSPYRIYPWPAVQSIPQSSFED